MRPFALLFLLWACNICLAVGMVPPAWAAAPASIFLQPAVSEPVWSSDPLRILLQPDEQACKKLYKSAWEKGCEITLGQSGAPISSLRVHTVHAKGTAHAKGAELLGHWLWTSPSELTFTPSTPWPADTSYTVDLKALNLPARVRLSSSLVRVSTPPLAAHMAQGQVWIDPDIKGQRGVSFALRFSSPPDRASLERKAQLIAQAPPNTADNTAGKGGLGLGSPRFIWTEGNSRCQISVPLLALPPKSQALTLRLPHIRPLNYVNEKWQIQDGEASQSVTVPGAATLFRITQSTLECVKNAHLQDEYHLVLRSSLRVGPQAVLDQLRVVALPRTQNPEASIPYRWDAAPALTDADLLKGEKLQPEAVVLPGESGDVLRFRIPVKAGAYVFCSLPAGFGAPGSLGLAAPWKGVFAAKVPAASLAFLQPGNVLTLGGERKLDLVSNGISHIRWRATRVLRDRLHALGDESDPFDSPWLDLTPNANTVEGSLTLPPVKNQLTPSFSVLDMTPLLSSPESTGLISMELEGLYDNKPVVEAKRLILITDLGMVVKKAVDDSRDVFVCSLSGGSPAAKVTVQIVGRNGKAVAEALTNDQGHARLPSVRGLLREKEAVALIATREVQGRSDMAWMSLKDESTESVDYSRFKVEGQRTAEANINACVFSQRGVYRPGERLHFGIILRQGDWQPLPADLPLTATLRNSEDQILMRQPFTCGDSLSSLSWDVPENAATGTYRLDISTPDPAASPLSTQGEAPSLIIGSGRVRVEEFQPDTLALSASTLIHKGPASTAAAGQDAIPTAAQDAGWAHIPNAETALFLKVQVRNLYGLPAAKRRVKVSLRTENAHFHFSQSAYADYTFDNLVPLLPGRDQDAALPDQEVYTDEEGVALLPVDSAQGRSRNVVCSFAIEAFEPDGGRAVTASHSLSLSPFSSLLGYRLSGAQNNLGYLPKGSDASLDFVTVDSSSKGTSSGPLTFTVAERRFVTSLVSDQDGRYSYDESPIEQESASTSHSISATQPLRWKMPTDKPGEYVLSVRDAQGLLKAKIPFTVAGDDDLRPALVESVHKLPSSSLRVRVDKDDYAPGEKVQIFVTAPYAGVGLITLERDRVASHLWFKAQAGHSVHSLTLPKDFEGRGYVNVSVARALNSPEIFMKAHSYALAPITVNARGRDMGLSLKAPKTALPGQPMTVTLRAQKPGRAILFAVDEGVLQLTNFATPNPLDYLLLNRALGVNTHQLFDRLMPDHALLRARIPAFGGGDDEGRPLQGLFNPFKRKNEAPMSWWSDTVDVGPEGKEITLPVPAYYSGTVRLMAVGTSTRADNFACVGSTDTQSLVRGPLVLSPQMPLVAAPGDRFAGGLNVANTTDHEQVLRLTLTPDAALQLTQSPPTEVKVAAHAEVLVPLFFQVGDSLGNASLQYRLTNTEGQESTRSVSLSVRPPTPLQIALRTGRSASSTTIPVNRELYTYEATGSVALSATPLPALRGLLRYVQNTPFDGVEQNISRAFASALLLRRPALAESLQNEAPLPRTQAQKKSQDTQDKALTALRSGMSYTGLRPWVYSENGDVLLTAYGGDYLLALQEGGLALPGDLSTSFFDTLENITDKEVTSLNAARAQAYAIWVLTREGRITSQKLEQLQNFVKAHPQECREDVLSTLMAGSYAIMHMDEQARQALLPTLKGMTDPVRLAAFKNDGFMNALAAQALHVSVLARHFPEDLARQTEPLATVLTEALNDPYSYATFSAALGARALLDLSQGGAQADFHNIGLSCTQMQPGFTGHLPDKGQVQNGMLTLDAPGCASFALHMPEAAQQKSPPLYWEMNSQGYDRSVPTKALAEHLEVTRRYTNAEGQEIQPNTTIRQGQVLTVTLQLRLFQPPAEGTKSPIVLIDLLPGGFEQALIPAEDSTSTPREHIDRREDRTVLQIQELPDGAASYVFHIRAVHKGVFALPAAQAEGMYDRRLRAHTPGGSVTVE